MSFYNYPIFKSTSFSLFLLIYRLYENVLIPRESTIKFEVYDYDKLSRDDFIGMFELKFDENGYHCHGKDGQNGFKIIQEQLITEDGEGVFRKKSGKPSILKLEIKTHTQK